MTITLMNKNILDGFEKVYNQLMNAAYVQIL